jgi:hypothetical protein
MSDFMPISANFPVILETENMTSLSLFDCIHLIFSSKDGPPPRTMHVLPAKVSFSISAGRRFSAILAFLSKSGTAIEIF